MGKIFGISKLPVAKPFPSLDFGRTQFINVGQDVVPALKNGSSKDAFIKKTSGSGLMSHLSKFFHRKHTKV